MANYISSGHSIVWIWTPARSINFRQVAEGLLNSWRRVNDRPSWILISEIAWCRLADSEPPNYRHGMPMFTLTKRMRSECEYVIRRRLEIDSIHASKSSGRFSDTALFILP